MTVLLQVDYEDSSYDHFMRSRGYCAIFRAGTRVGACVVAAASGMEYVGHDGDHETSEYDKTRNEHVTITWPQEEDQ